MPIKVNIEVPNADTRLASEIMQLATDALKEVHQVIEAFARDRIDCKVVLTDRAGQPYGEIEILRF